MPLFEPLARAWPFHPGDAGWRFLMVSVFIDHGATLLVGLVLATMTALLLDDRLALRRLGFIALLLGALLVALVLLLLVHLILLRRELDAAVQVFDLGVTRRVLAGLLLGLTFIGVWFGVRRGQSMLPERAIGSRRTSDRIVGK